ncbi:hypothetical protein Tco_0875788 [Tanacetum coccineum]|uniref:Uncharacterized protein n=1 Tax=Tanacetum coccineum TaxID=301880 RepID=A0ABQ5BTC8_9ASTR
MRSSMQASARHRIGDTHSPRTNRTRRCAIQYRSGDRERNLGCYEDYGDSGDAGGEDKASSLATSKSDHRLDSLKPHPLRRQ